jgi:hypothetical protein
MKLGGTHLPEANKKVFGYNYKQNILNKRNVAANATTIESNNSKKNATPASAELIAMMQEALAETKRKLQAENSITFIKSGRCGSEGTLVPAYVKYGESLAIYMVHPANTSIAMLAIGSKCESNTVGPFTITYCFITNMELQEVKKMFNVGVRGPGPVFYELVYIGQK